MSEPMTAKRLVTKVEAAVLDHEGDARLVVTDLLVEFVRIRAKLIDLQNDALNIRGMLSPNGFPRRVPMALGAELAPAIEWLLAENERLELALEDAQGRLADSGGQP